ncbi:uncharacterized protein LOC126484670 [Schistocerca serialis cubense]|uniref:uncharacterized protein LOC126484670 n=1 Tax=Schistocerca serialis cubense TaxID=2023355 RepID=UPI00214EE222|nr:uncharacterized protein LOC126484670 [Schistocerca serialis cubense]
MDLAPVTAQPATSPVLCLRRGHSKCQQPPYTVADLTYDHATATSPAPVARSLPRNVCYQTALSCCTVCTALSATHLGESCRATGRPTSSYTLCRHSHAAQAGSNTHQQQRRGLPLQEVADCLAEAGLVQWQHSSRQTGPFQQRRRMRPLCLLPPLQLLLIIAGVSAQDCRPPGHGCADDYACCDGCCLSGVCEYTRAPCYIDRDDMCLSHYCPGGFECYLYQPHVSVAPYPDCRPVKN